MRVFAWRPTSSPAVGGGRGGRRLEHVADPAERLRPQAVSWGKSRGGKGLSNEDTNDFQPKDGR